MNEVVDAERLEHEHDAAEVGPLDLGDGVIVKLVEVGHLVYSRKHLPGATARWLAEALVMDVTMSDSMPDFGLYEFCLAKPGSMT